MSIWCSHEPIGFDDFPPRRWKRPRGGQVRSYATGWSNHYPTTDDTVEQRAMIDLASIAPWCVPGHEQHDGRDLATGPWIRLSVHSRRHAHFDPATAIGPEHADVVMDEPAVRELVRQLTEWLDRPKVKPA
jgi:hypothetical protein